MNYYDMRNIVETCNYVFNFINDLNFKFEDKGGIIWKELKAKIDKHDDKDYTMNITYENDGDKFIDVDIGLMNFTFIYDENNDRIHICENPTYYIYNEAGEVEETIDVEL